ncbi:WW domain binding protein 4 [Umbelopsis nana]
MYVTLDTLPNALNGSLQSISIHENGKAHKEMVEKFLRDVYKRGKESQKEKAEVQKELERIEQAAISSYNSKDAGFGSRIKLPPAPSKPPAAAKSSKPAPKSQPPPAPKQSEPFEMPVPRAMQAEAAPGEWTIVTKPVSEAKSDSDVADTKRPTTTHDLRPEMQDDFAADEEDLRSFKIQEKSYPEDTFVNDEENKDDGGGVVFKKRKLGGQAKGRNIRKK